MKYISMCSGIEAATVAWQELGWRPVAFAEIDEFPSAVLANRFPDVKNLGDITKVDWNAYHDAADVVVAGFPCFPAGTLVLTDKKLVPIENIKCGDKVLTHKNRWRKVTGVGSHKADTIILKGQGTSGIECTPNHPFYASKKLFAWNNNRRSYDRYLSTPEWISANDMCGRMWKNMSGCTNDESEIPRFRMRGHAHDYEFSEAFFYFIGRWLGDGWASSHKRPERMNSFIKQVFVCCAHNLGDDLQSRLEETGLLFTRIEVRTTTQFCCSSQPLYDWVVRNFGKGAGGKYLPSWALSMPVEYREALFLGYIDSDGTHYGNNVKSSSISKPLTIGMKMIAAGIGYPSGVVRVKNKRKECRIEGRLVNERPYFCQTYYSSPRSAVICEDGFWGLVRKTLPGNKNVLVYNLEVEEDHSYTADGIAVHNCQSYSIAGLRKGLADPRGQIMLECLTAIHRINPEWVVLENVPGILSSHRGRDFKTLLDAVAILWPGGGRRLEDFGRSMVRCPTAS